MTFQHLQVLDTTPQVITSVILNSADTFKYTTCLPASKHLIIIHNCQKINDLPQYGPCSLPLPKT